MKPKLRTITTILLVLISLVTLGCADKGEQAVEDAVKRTIPQTVKYEKIGYRPINKTGLVRIEFKLTGQDGKSNNFTRYYSIGKDNKVFPVNTTGIPKNFLFLLEEDHPDTFLSDIRTYNHLGEMQSKVTDVVDFMDEKLDEALDAGYGALGLWQNLEENAKLANSTIEAYESAYNQAPLYISSNFPSPPDTYDIYIEYNVIVDGEYCDWFIHH